jgi:hypothetical protein
MVLSKRERVIIAGSVLVLGALGLDQFALTPLLDAWDKTQAQKRGLQSEMTRSQAALKSGRELGPKWREMTAAGIKLDPAEAESQALHAIRDWAAESGVALAMLKPDRLTDKTQLPAISFQANAVGSMDGIGKWLWRMQYAKVPMRITELTLSSRKEGTDDLTATLRLSTLYMTAQASTAAPAKGARPARATEDEQ